MSLEINDEIIEDDIIDEELEYALKNWDRPPTPEERKSLLQEVKEGLIYKTLLNQEAKKLTTPISQQTIDREYHLFFAHQTPPEGKEQVMLYLENKLRESQVIEHICQDLKPPETSHLRIFFEDNKDHYFIAKEFQYRELGFRYPQPSFHPRLYDILSKIRKEITPPSPTQLNHPHLPDNQALEEIKKLIGESEDREILPYLFSRQWKVAVGELNRDGLKFLDHLTEVQVSQITDYPGESLLFSPVEALTPHQSKDPCLGLFIHIQTRRDFTPTFEESVGKVRGDLWEEMRQIKVKAYLRRVMERSTIRDISYI